MSVITYPPWHVKTLDSYITVSLHCYLYKTSEVKPGNAKTACRLVIGMNIYLETVLTADYPKPPDIVSK